MKAKNTLRWLHFSLFGLTLWFFGNLYEEVILMPNWLVAPLSVLKSYNQYYTVVIQYHYYVPITQLAVIVLIALCFVNNPARELARPALRRSAVWGVVALILTAYIVLTLNLDLFIGTLKLSEQAAHDKGSIWMIGNAVRLFCVGMSWHYAFNVRDHLKQVTDQPMHRWNG